MSNDDGTFFESEGVRAAMRIDYLADRFEAAWVAGAVPSIGAFISGLHGHDRLTLLEELIRVDRAYRSRVGQDRTQDDYRNEFPELPVDWEWHAPTQMFDGDSMVDRDRRGDRDAVTTARSSGWVVRVPGYEILEELGRGSMGVVYLARDARLKRDVALKMILMGTFAGAEQLARFRTEAEAVARLKHPHIVQIYEVGEHDGLPYCSLEYVEGGSLSQKLNGIPQPPLHAAEMTRQLALAVDAAHQQGIIHRDLKPANILLSTDGQPKIADFGLAKYLDRDAGYTQSGVAIGTPSYMAVEQAEGRTHDVGPAADVYALGAILYEMLTGRPPFRGATWMETLEQVRAFDLVPPSRLQTKVPRDVQTICLKAMAREPTLRYATAGLLADDLRRWLDGAPILARPQGLVYRFAKWARRRPAAAALVALAAVSATSLAAGVWWHTVQLQQALVQIDDERRQSDLLRAASDEHRQRAEALVYAGDVRLGTAAFLDGDTVEAVRRLERHLPGPGQNDQREFAWHQLWTWCHPEKVVFRGHSGDVYCVRVVGNGQRLVTAGRDGVLRSWSIDDPTHPEVLARHSGELNFLAIAPDGVTLAAGSDDGTVQLWNVATRAEIGRFAAHANWVLCGAISADGGALATGGRDNTIRLWSLNGEMKQELHGHTSTIESVAFLPDGSKLASTGTDGSLRLWDLTSGEGDVLGTHRLPVFSVACSHDGQLLATGCEDHVIYLWEVATRRLRGRLRGNLDAVQSVEFSADDLWLASAGKDGSARIWDVAGQTQVESLVPATSRVWSIAWLADGSGLASASGDGTISLSRLRGKLTEQLLPELPVAPERVLFCWRERRIWFFGVHSTVVTQAPGESSVPINNPQPRHWVRCASAAASADAMAIVWGPELQSEDLIEPDELVLYTGAGTRLAPPLELRPNVTGIALAADGRQAAVACYPNQLLLYDLPSGRLRWSVQIRGSYRVRQLVFADARKEVFCLSGDGQFAKAFAVADGHSRTVLSLPFDQRLTTTAAISPDARLLAGWTDDHTLRVWSFGSENAEVARLQKSEDRVVSSTFSPDGRTLAAAADSGVVTLWHVGTWQEMGSFKTRLEALTDLRFSTDGRALAIAGRSADGNGQIVLWESKPTDD
jgi:eukaryotic-like serine/threonine-protein kinase